MIQRTIENRIEDKFFKKKSIILYGARQVGKTTLLESIVNKRNEKVMWLNCDEPDVRKILTDVTSTRIKSIIGNSSIVVIDEAQRIENIGLVIKLFVDNLKNIQVVATGSSSLELADKISEPLTGRKYLFTLYPLSFREMADSTSLSEEKRMLEHRLVYGYYPEVVTNPGEEEERLLLLADSYLYKDILTMELIKKPVLIDKLLRMLALQVGSEVSYKEIGTAIGADNETVEKYIDLLEKSFVIFRLNSFSRNKRNEIKKGKKIYFYDNGIRNSIIRNFNPISLRTDKGALFENFLISERMKKISYTGSNATPYFWRTVQQQEIDYVEEDANRLDAFEFKWKSGSKARQPGTFMKAYPGSSFRDVTSSDFEDFVM
ncbi:MAG: ATP-binding protein [Ignavibacteria bacterium]|nr:ATP-binding protein [Ignavibacteria bacterium]